MKFTTPASLVVAIAASSSLAAPVALPPPPSSNANTPNPNVFARSPNPGDYPASPMLPASPFIGAAAELGLGIGFEGHRRTIVPSARFKRQAPLSPPGPLPIGDGAAEVPMEAPMSPSSLPDTDAPAVPSPDAPSASPDAAPTPPSEPEPVDATEGTLNVAIAPPADTPSNPSSIPIVLDVPFPSPPSPPTVADTPSPPSPDADATTVSSLGLLTPVTDALGNVIGTLKDILGKIPIVGPLVSGLLDIPGGLLGSLSVDEVATLKSATDDAMGVIQSVAAHAQQEQAGGATPPAAPEADPSDVPAEGAESVHLANVEESPEEVGDDGEAEGEEDEAAAAPSGGSAFTRRQFEYYDC